MAWRAPSFWQGFWQVPTAAGKPACSPDCNRNGVRQRPPACRSKLKAQFADNPAAKMTGRRPRRERKDSAAVGGAKVVREPLRCICQLSWCQQGATNAGATAGVVTKTVAIDVDGLECLSQVVALDSVLGVQKEPSPREPCTTYRHYDVGASLLGKGPARRVATRPEAPERRVELDQKLTFTRQGRRILSPRASPTRVEQCRQIPCLPRCAGQRGRNTPLDFQKAPKLVERIGFTDRNGRRGVAGSVKHR